MLSKMVNINLMLNLGRKVEMKMEMPRGMAVDIMKKLGNAVNTKENTPIVTVDSQNGKAIFIKPKTVVFGYIDTENTAQINEVQKKKCSCDHKTKNELEERHIAKPKSIGEVIEEKMIDGNVPQEYTKDLDEESKRMNFEKGTPEYYKHTHKVMIDCKECGNRSFARLYKDSKEANCKLCGASVEISELIQAKVQCKCGYNYKIDVPVDCREVKCMNCNAPVDLKLNEKKNILVSVN